MHRILLPGKRSSEFFRHHRFVSSTDYSVQTTLSSVTDFLHFGMKIEDCRAELKLLRRACQGNSKVYNLGCLVLFLSFYVFFSSAFHKPDILCSKMFEDDNKLFQLVAFCSHAESCNALPVFGVWFVL
jgi:hypothetical protein